ncbi:hypothetical protein F5884DRAFT_805397 [Xylogone sp. PMI_703]|nr:hypothetical protein F5884DRAFT_805397 [Xylogone sp. PMI_703]
MQPHRAAYIFHILVFGTLALAYRPNCTDWYNVIDTESDVQAIEQYCTILDGNLGVNTAFKGALDLPGVEHIDQLLIPYDFDDPCNLTEISLPDLLNVTVISITNIPLVTNISFPKLREVGIITPYGDLNGQAGISNEGGQLLNLSFPMLENVWGGFFLTGNIGSISVPSLKNMSYFFANSSSDLDCIPLVNSFKFITHANFSAVCTSTRSHALLANGVFEFGPGYCRLNDSTCSWENSTSTGTSPGASTRSSAPSATESGKTGGSGATGLSTERSGTVVVGMSVVLAAILMAAL